MRHVLSLLALRGIGEGSAWIYATECFSWRAFRNRREVGVLAGLARTTRASGDVAREHGISKAGNVWIRALAIELAWSWVRHQPTSALTPWFHRRFAKGGPRQRRIGIVAVARKLLVALWRYLETGLAPGGHDEGVTARRTAGRSRVRRARAWCGFRSGIAPDRGPPVQKGPRAVRAVPVLCLWCAEPRVALGHG